MFFIGNMVMAIAVLPFVSKFGLSWTLSGAMIISSLGCFTRMFVDHWFGFILIGQFMNGMAACFIVNTVMQFCYIWFHPRTRPLYLSVASVMNIFGGGLGNTVPLIFVNNKETNLELLRNQVDSYNFSMLILMASLTAITLLLFREKPPRGYGYVNSKKDEEVFHLKEGNFLTNNYRFLKLSMSFPLFRTYLLIYVIPNTCLVFMGSIINMIVEFFQFSSVS